MTFGKSSRILYPRILGGAGVISKGYIEGIAPVHHDGLIMDLGGQQYGRVALGLEPNGRI